jgi:hypothetical protein
MADLIFLAGGGRDLTETAIIPSVTVQVEHSMENSISKYPIEKSPDGAYNAVVRNNVVTVKGAFSNIHLPSVLFENSTPDIIGNVEIGDATAEEGGTQPAVTGIDRPSEAFNLIEDARDTLKYLDIVTGYKTYKDCLIKSFNVTENKDTGNLMSFELVFEQPRFTTVTNAVSANVVKPLEDPADENSKLSTQEKKDKSEVEANCKGTFFEGVCRTVNTYSKAAVDTDPAVLGN